MDRKTLRQIINLIAVAVGCAVYAVGFDLFLSPYDIVPGGASGVAMIINRIFGAPSIGTIIILINVPLLIAAFFKLGYRFVLRTAYGAVLLSLFIDAFSFIPGVETEPVLAALFGGLSCGLGLGIVLLFGSTTGGVDVAAQLIRKRWPSAKMGRVILAIDAVIVVSAAIVLKNLGSAMYAIVLIYVESVVADKVLYGSENARMAYIISEKSEEIAKMLMEQVERGVTYLHGTGAYTMDEKNVIFCVIKRREVARVKRFVKEADPNAFFVLCSANEVLGNGFYPEA